MKCIKCQSENLHVIQSGPHYKLVCTDCLTFQKFLSKTEFNVFNALSVPKIPKTKNALTKTRLEVLKTIADDMEQDAHNFEGAPFDGKTVATYLGSLGAAIATLADIITSICIDLNME